MVKTGTSISQLRQTNCHFLSRRSFHLASHEIFSGDTSGEAENSHSVPQARVRVSPNVIVPRVRTRRHVQTIESLRVADFDFLERAGGTVSAYDYAVFLRHCGTTKALQEGRYVHSHILKHSYEQNTFLGNLVIQMYGKCSNLDDALSAFKSLMLKNVFSWNIVISMYVEHGHGRQALKVFQQMISYHVAPHEATFVSVLSACVCVQSLAEGKWIHEYASTCGVELDFVVGTALVNMYGKCGSLEGAREVFDKLLERDVITWSNMIAIHAQHGQGYEAFQVFQQMLLIGMFPNNITYLGLIDACTSSVDKVNGVRVHATLVKSDCEWDLMVCSAIINMYGKCGSLKNARILFDTMPERNVVTWSSMIGAYAQQDHGKDALELFWKMHLKGIEPDRITFVCILDACASCAALAKGRIIHVFVIERGFELDMVVRTSIVNMYAKCGKLADARSMFEKMEVRNVVSWNSMISAYAQHGHSKLALQLYMRMGKDGVLPSKVTFFSVLSACSFAGLMDEARDYFDSMERDYGLAPEAVHYNCLIDLFGRAGRLEEGENLIRSMPCPPTSASWMTLLSACRVKLDAPRAKYAAERVADLDPGNAAPFVMLSNVYAACGMWEEVIGVRKYLKEKGLKKQPGRSSIEIDGQTHEFSVADEMHPKCQEIYAELDRLNKEMKEAGYAPDTKVVLHDVDQETKEHVVCYHSEKIALAFGLLSTPPCTSIRIIKNLRACPDCHSAFKFVSKLSNREIIVRDASRFHIIRGGICSCADYW